VKVSGFGEIALGRNPGRGEDRVKCGFEFCDGVLGFDVKHSSLWLFETRGYDMLR
jgi:hypothetical protein